jgi:hypothetical protein
MSYLFDVSPDEPVKGKAKRRAEEPRPTEAVFSAPVAAPERPEYLGKADGVPCLYSPCGCACNDITDVGLHRLNGKEYEPAWRLECVVCGTGQWIAPLDDRFDAKPEPEASSPDAFVFDDGPFKGKTIDEVFSEYGTKVVQMLAQDRHHPAWRAACQSWLDLRNRPA